MNEYTRIRNTHDRAVILAQLVNADAQAMIAAASRDDGSVGSITTVNYADAAEHYLASRDELWKLIGPAEASEA